MAEKVKENKASASKTGECLCCGGATKGGNFQPGHDSRYVSELVEAYFGATRQADRTAIEKKIAAVGSEKLTGKFEKSVRLRAEREERAKAEAAAK